MKLRRILALARKEWREITRDRIYLMLAFVLPLVLMLVFGHGMSQEVEHVGLAALDEDRSAMSRDFIDHFTKTHHFRVIGHLASEREIDPLLASGRARAVIWIAPRFQEDLHRGRTVVVQFAVDGTFPFPARTLAGYLEAIGQAASLEVRAGALARREGLPMDQAAALLQPVKLQVRYLYNEEVRSLWTIAPALLMLILLMVPPLLMAISVVREKETGSIYNLRCSTISRAEFILGKLLPNVAVSLLDAAVLWAMAVWYFGAPFKGDAWIFGAGTLLYVIGTSAGGLLVSMLVRTQQAAIIITTMTASIVATQFSGLFATVESMTGGSYVLARSFSASYYHDLIIGTFLKRTGWLALAPEFAFLLLYALALLAACYALFRKRSRT